MPWTILYAADGEVHSIGPFSSEDAAYEGASKAQTDGEFDIDNQHIYIMRPDHSKYEIMRSDLA